MPRLRDYFEDVNNAQAIPSTFPPTSNPPSPSFSHDAFPYHYSASSAPSSPRQESPTLASSSRSGIYNDPRSKSYVRYLIDPSDVSNGAGGGGGGEPSLHQLADRHVRGRVVRKPIKPTKGGAGQKGKAAAPEAGLEDGSAGIGAVLLSMGRGPEGSGKAVVVGNDILRIVQFTSPSDLKPLPPPPHWVPLTFSTSNYAPPVPSSLTSRTPTTPPLAAPYGRNGNNNRRRPSQAPPKPASRVPSDVGQDEGTVIGEGPGGIALREIATLRGLREATGGSGVVEARWGWGGQASRIFVSGRKGNVMVWDVHSPSKMHTDIRVDPTRRPISVMRFGPAKDSSPTAASMVTGGHDSILRLYDFRMPSATPAMTHSLSPALTSPITALAVSPTTALHVVLGLENGTIGWIDWRRTGRLVNRKFSAHGEGGVMTLDWKDGGRGGGDGWIASGGLDKKIHVWNMDDSSRPLHRTLRCAQPVAEVLWRPGHETELAVVPYVALSGSNTGDEPEEVSAVQIWDVRRSHLPKHVLEGGDGAACGVAWNDHGALWAAYKTGTVVQHDVRHSSVPLLNLPGTSSTWTPTGHLTFTAHRQHEGEAPFDDMLPAAAAQLETPPEPKSMGDPVYDPDQVAVEVLVDGYTAGKAALLAGRYRFAGKDPKALCKKNAQIAAVAFAWQDHQVWRTLEGMIGTWQELADAEAAQVPLPAPSALHDIPDLHLPPPRDTSPLRGRSNVATSGGDERNGASGQRGPSRSPLINAVRPDVGVAPRQSSAEQAQVPEGDKADYADTFAVRLNLAVDDSDLEEAVTLSSESEDIESSSSSSEDQLQTIPIPRQSRSKRSSFSSRRPSSSSQTRPGFSSPLAAHHGISASLPARQSSPHPNPRSYLRQFQGQNRLSPVHTPQANGPDSDSGDDTPQANSPHLSDDAYGVDPYGTGYGQASFMSTTSSKTSVARTAVSETPSAASRPITRAPRTAKSSPKVIASTTTTGARRSSFPTAQPLATQLRSQRAADVASPAVSALRQPRLQQQVEQMTIDDFELSGRRTLGAIITDYLDQGNCQMPSLIFIITRALFPLSHSRAERYITAYYSLLTRLRLYSAAAKLRKHSGLPGVQAAVRKNTMTYLSCARHPAHALPYEDLPAPLASNSWCLEDARPAIVCCFCSKAVVGVLSGCELCGHGGHWLCMERWWKTAAETTPASVEQEVVQRVDTPPLTAPGSGNGNGSDSSPTIPARSPLATFSTRSETTGEYGTAGSDVETVIWGWLCPTGCGCRCAVSHSGPPASAQPTPLLLPPLSRRSSLT